jgi:hypothetical protein
MVVVIGVGFIVSYGLHYNRGVKNERRGKNVTLEL